MAGVWWLRESGTVSSTPIALCIGMALSLLASALGQAVWEKLPGSEDLLFNELMVWGYVARLRKQRRLAHTADLISEDTEEARRQRRLLGRLVAAMETRDPYLHGHSRRVARHSWAIAQRMKLPREEVARIRAAAALHDVGKTKTPKTILHKAGRLTDEEYRIIQLHPGEGAQMTAVLRDERLDAMVRHHHERLDGSGYPDGLAGEAIPLGARIIAVADTFDAITSARPYRAASPHKKAIDILREEAGTRLDPDVVKAFCSNYAGRGPLALWSFVAGLPERLVTWLSSSVGAVASAAKVVAVAAIVGGAAAGSSTLSLLGANPASGHARRSSHAAPVSRAVPVRGSGAAAVAGSGRGAAGTGTTGGRARRKVAIPAAPSSGASSTGVSEGVGVGAAPGSTAGGETRSGSSSGGQERSASKEEQGSSRSEETKTKAEEPKARKEEGSSGKPEESPAAKTEERGKSTEAGGTGKKEEVSSRAGGERPSSKGSGSESSGSGPSGESGKGSGGSSGKGASESGGKPAEAGESGGKGKA